MRSWSGIGCCRLPGLFSQLPPLEVLRIPGRALFAKVNVHSNIHIWKQKYILQKYILSHSWQGPVFANYSEKCTFKRLCTKLHSYTHVDKSIFSQIHCIFTSMAGSCTQILHCMIVKQMYFNTFTSYLITKMPCTPSSAL